MNCNIIKDLIPLYIDGCCSKESEKIVSEHIKCCDDCKRLFDDMNTPSDTVVVTEAPIAFNKINDWKASVLQSVLLFISFAFITIGVALESTSPSGLMNGFWAMNLVIPVTGFMLSLANWYFVRIYKSRQRFSNCSFIATLSITICAYLWAGVHYEMSLFEILAGLSFMESLETVTAVMFFNGIGIALTAGLCILSKTLSNRYAKMLGKE